MKKAFLREGFFYALERNLVSTMAGNKVENFLGRYFPEGLKARKVSCTKAPYPGIP